MGLPPRGSLMHETRPVIIPVSVAVHECELKSDEAIEVGVIVPGRFVQEEDVPVRGEEHEAGETVEAAEHDAQSPFSEKRTPSVILSILIHIN